MDKIRICVVITRMIRGGAALVALSQAAALNPEKYEVVIITGPRDSEGDTLIERAMELGLDVRVVPALVRDVHPKKDVSALFKLFRLIRGLEPHVVHTHTSKAGILGRLAARLAGVPVILHSPHGHIYSKNARIPGVEGRGARRRFFWNMEKFTNSFTDRIVTLTDKNAREQATLGLGPACKFLAVHNGIDPDVFAFDDSLRKKTRRELGITESAFVCGMVGRLTAEKGHGGFLDAACVLREKRPDARFLIVGDGPLKKDLADSCSQNGLDGSVLFLGQREDVSCLLAAMDVLVLPSLYEGLGVAALEAMAAGLPVVANNVGGVPEVVLHGKTGILVPPGRNEELARALISLASNSELAKRLGDSGLMRVREFFTADLMVKRLENIYTSLLKRKGLVE